MLVLIYVFSSYSSTFFVIFFYFQQIIACASVLFIMVSVISFCLKTHPGFRVEMTPSFHSDFINSSYYNRNTYAHLSSATPTTAMPKTSTFKYVSISSSSSSTSSDSNFDPSSTENPSSSQPTTIFPSTYRNERNGKLSSRHVNFNSEQKSNFREYDQPHEAFFYVELLCNLWFIIEFSTRFLVIGKFMFFLFEIQFSNLHVFELNYKINKSCSLSL